jgi:hypothetical protein
MPAELRELSLDEFELLLTAYCQNPSRTISSVHLHHSGVPDHSGWQGLQSLEAIKRFHTVERGLSDIAQHLTIDPYGRIWSGRAWYRAPASSRGIDPHTQLRANGDSRRGPFMIVLVGHFGAADGAARDRLIEPQRDTLIAVLARLLRKALVDADGKPPACAQRVFPHAAMDAQRGCPGAGLVNRNGSANAGLDAALCDEVDAAGDALVATLSPLSTEHAKALARDPLLCPSPGDRDAADQVGDDQSDAPEQGLGEQRLRALTRTIRAARAATSHERRRCIEADDDVLRQHIVNLAFGALSDASSSAWQTSKPDIDDIFGKHLPEWAAAQRASGRTPRLLVYAHGGLVSETDAIAYARQHIRFWKENGVYPIFIVWETGFFEVFLQRYLGARGLLDWPIEKAAALIGKPAWSLIKQSASEAFKREIGPDRAPGGGYQVLQKLGELLSADPGIGLELHALGHSAGSIFITEMLKRWMDEPAPEIAAPKPLKRPEFTSVQFLAPALRTDRFTQEFRGRDGKPNGPWLTTDGSSRIKRFAVFTMDEERERDDNVAWAYRKSLLYLVCRGCEDRRPPLLGLQESIRGDASLSDQGGFFDPKHRAFGIEMIWSSRSGSSDGRALSDAVAHGDFDNEPLTMNSVLRRVLGMNDEARGYLDYCRQVACADLCSADRRGFARLRSSTAIAAPWGDPASPVRGAEAMAGKSPSAEVLRANPSFGNRRALVIGINDYAGSPLEGCVADAEAWRQAFETLGFATPRFLKNAAATRTAVIEALTSMLTGAQPGDVLCFFFAGHGTRGVFSSHNAEEADHRDDNLVLADYENGGLLGDDELAVLLSNAPKGVMVYVFIDCCHSGTLLRAVGKRARSILLAPRSFERHRERKATETSGARSRGQASVLLFAACMETQVAREQNGRGDFSTRAVPALMKAASAKTSAIEFIHEVTGSMPDPGDQTPQLQVYDKLHQHVPMLSAHVVDNDRTLRQR